MKYPISPCATGNASSNGPFSIAMFVYRRLQIQVSPDFASSSLHFNPRFKPRRKGTEKTKPRICTRVPPLSQECLLGSNDLNIYIYTSINGIWHTKKIIWSIKKLEPSKESIYLPFLFITSQKMAAVKKKNDEVVLSEKKQKKLAIFGPERLAWFFQVPIRVGFM